jgi:hypothetical protein
MNKTIRAGRGLGDAIYLQSVVRHLVNKGQKLTVATDWTDVFLPLKDKIEFIPFTRQNIKIIAHYSARKSFKDTTQFRDCCLQAGITEKAELKIDWKPLNSFLIDSLRVSKPLLVIALPRAPMGRTDAFAIDLLPKRDVYQYLIDKLRDKYNILQIGAGKPVYTLDNIDIDLTNDTKVTDLFDIASVADAFVGYCSYLIPLAESFNKKGLYIWGNKGLKSSEQFINTITPTKILEHKNSHFLVDNWELERMDDAINAFLQEN